MCIPKRYVSVYKEAVYHANYAKNMVQRQTVLFFIAIISILSLVAADCDSQSIQKVKACYVPYLAGFNLTLIDNRLPYYWDFHNSRTYWVATAGMAALYPICDLFHTLQDCLKPYTCLTYNDYQTTLGPVNYTGPENMYWQDRAVSEYQCGAGFTIGQQEGYCIAVARSKYEKELHACEADLDSNIQKKGKCKAEQTLLNCQTTILQKACDWNAGVYMCNCVLAGFNSMDPSCYDNKQLSCPNPRQVFKLFGKFAFPRTLF